MKFRFFILTMILLTAMMNLPTVRSETFYPDTEPELQAAMDAAEHNVEDDIIYIQPHHYALTGTLNFNPTHLYSRNSLTIEGVTGTSGPPRLDGMSQYQILAIDTFSSANDYDAEFLIKNLIFQNAGDNNYGSAIHLHTYSALTTITNCYFYNNNCYFQGGAVFAVCTGDINILNNIFYKNSSSGQAGDSKGGAVYLRLYSDLNVIMNNTFIENSAEGFADQAYFSCSGGVTNVYNNLFWPGDVRGYLYSDESTLNLFNNNFETRAIGGIGTFNEGDNFQEDPNLDSNFSPLYGSVCIDNGESYHGIPRWDFRGNARPNPNTGIVDIGAIEYYGALPTSTPASTNTPVPGETPTPASGLGVQLNLPIWVHPDEYFWVEGIITNDGAPLDEIPVLFMLDVLGSYWFWPCWEPAGSGSAPFCHEIMTIPTGITSIGVLPLFVWPDTRSDTMSGLYFYGAMLQPDFSDILGTWDAREFGFGPL